jgi:predicted Fe-Mo cluster-binding NifX family protein
MTTTATTKKNIEQVARYADMFSAMGTEARLRIMQLLLSAHPDGLVVGEIQEELAHQLAEVGIVIHEENAFLFLFRHRHPKPF